MQPGHPCERDEAPARPEVVPRGRHIALLQLASAASGADRYLFPPLIVAIGIDMGASVAAVVTAVVAHALFFGVSQPAWAAASDRLGRRRTIRLALALAAAGGVGAALAPTLAVLTVARAFTGATIAAVIPTSLVYVGETMPPARRQPTLGRLTAGVAAGGFVGTAGAGLTASLLDWRWAFAIPAVVAVVLAVSLRDLPEVPKTPSPILPAFGRVVRRRWALVVLGFAFVEGALWLGAFTYLAPAVERFGSSTATAGFVVSLYCLGAIVSSSLLGLRWCRRARRHTLIAAGGGTMILGFALAAVSQAAPAMAGAAVLLGVGFIMMHTTMQLWIVEVAPGERAAAVALFASMLFIGSSAGTAALAPLAATDSFSLLFLVVAAIALPLVIAAAAARRRWPEPLQSTAPTAA